MISIVIPAFNEEKFLADCLLSLKNHQIAGAALDVYKTEPINPDNPLLKLDNVVLTPHIGSATIETRSMMAKIAIENLINVLNKNYKKAFIVNSEIICLGWRSTFLFFHQKLYG
jgi:phosphoglycerate dehydrogenase-like enzyme